MPTWTNQLPPEKAHMGFSLKRTPTDRPIRGICTCEDIAVTDTHFWGGRTIPCERPDCSACAASIPYRTHVYMSLFNPKTAEHVLFECTAAAAKPLIEYRDANGSLRGCMVTATRTKQTANGKVLISTTPYDITRLILPQPPNLQLALATIWRLPTAAIQSLRDDSPATAAKVGRPTGVTRLAVDSNQTAAVYNQPDNADGPPHLLDASPSGGARRNRKVPA